MIAVRIMQVALDQVIHMVAVRDRLVAAVRAMHMRRGMPTAGVLRGTCGGIRAGDIENMLIDVIAVHVVQVALVQVIGVPIMGDGNVTAARTMLVPVAVTATTQARAIRATSRAYSTSEAPSSS